MFSSQKLAPIETAVIDGILREWKGRWPQMGVMMLLPEAERQCIPAMQVLFSAQKIPLLGAVFPALVTDDGFVTAGAWLLCFERMPSSFVVADMGEAGSAKLEQAAAAMLDRTVADGGTPTLFMIFDAMIPNVATLLHELRGDLGARVEYAGVNAGSETFQPIPCLFDAEKSVSNGVLGMLLPEETLVVVRHGYPVSKKIMMATSGEGNRIDTINHRVAFEVYQDVMNAEYGITLTRENFYEFAVHFPFGVVTALDVLVRIPVGFNDDGSLYCVGEVPDCSLLRLLKAPDFQTSACVSEIVRSLKVAKRRVRAQPLLTFYCAGRRMHFGDDAGREVMQLRYLTEASVIFGALSLGEFDQDKELGFPRFHNAALVCVSQ